MFQTTNQLCSSNNETFGFNHQEPEGSVKLLCGPTGMPPPKKKNIKEKQVHQQNVQWFSPHSSNFLHDMFDGHSLVVKSPFWVNVLVSGWRHFCFNIC